MKTLFKTVMELLKTIPNLYIAENWGQLDIPQPPVNFPCALIDLGDMEFSQRGCLTQQGEGTLTISLSDIMYNGIDNVTPEILQEKEFAIFNTINDINALLHGKTGSEKNSSLIRTKIQKQIREDSIREFTLFYKFSYLDDSAQAKYTPVSVSPQIQIQK
ncbi:MAG: hypothetical protein RR256_04765 [Bacteroidales bacterium]